MDHTQELREKRMKLHTEGKAILESAKAAGRDMTSEERAKFDAIYAEVDGLKADIERAEKSDAEERFLAAVDDKRKTAPPKSSAAEKDAFRSFLENRSVTSLSHAAGQGEFGGVPVFAEGEQRAVALTNLAGAIDPEVVGKFEEALKYYGPMWRTSTITRTATGASLYMPTINDTGNAGTILAEAGTATTADPTFSSVVFGAYKVEAKYVLVSNETLQDTSIPLEPIIARLLGERIARGSNTMFTTKTNGPTGIMTTQCGAVSGKTATATNAFTLPEVIDLIHSVDVAHRVGASLMMHDNIIAAARKLVDSNNMFLWEPSVQAGQPDVLFGYPVFTNNDMASVLTTAAKIIAFGDLSKYQIRVAGGLDVAVARELFIQNYQTGFFGFLRVDGNLLDAGTDPVKWLNMA